MKKAKSFIALVMVLVMCISVCVGIPVSAEETAELQTTVLLDAETNINIYGAVRQSEKYVRGGSYSLYSSCVTGTYTDFFLYDIKAIDEDVHIKCTGHPN